MKRLRITAPKGYRLKVDRYDDGRITRRFHVFNTEGEEVATVIDRYNTSGVGDSYHHWTSELLADDGDRVTSRSSTGFGERTRNRALRRRTETTIDLLALVGTPAMAQRNVEAWTLDKYRACRS